MAMEKKVALIYDRPVTDIKGDILNFNQLHQEVFQTPQGTTGKGP